jgi:hypothetical protein
MSAPCKASCANTLLHYRFVTNADASTSPSVETGASALTRSRDHARLDNESASQRMHLRHGIARRHRPVETWLAEPPVAPTKRDDADPLLVGFGWLVLVGFPSAQSRRLETRLRLSRRLMRSWVSRGFVGYLQNTAVRRPDKE